MKRFSFKLAATMVATTMLLASCGTETQEVSSNVESNEDSNIVEEVEFLDVLNLEEFAKAVEITEDAVTFTDERGEVVTIPKNPQSVAGLINSYTNLWYVSGGGWEREGRK